MHVVQAWAVGALALALVLSSASRAHEGHDHDAPTSQPSAGVTPRAEAHSDSFELVAIAEGDRLAIYLDRFDTNAPVDDATVDLETPQGPAAATRGDDGVFRVAAPWLRAGGHIDLIVTVAAGDAIDILPLSLDLPAGGSGAPPPDAVGVHLRAMLQPPALAAGGVGLALGIAVMAFGRRGRRIAAVAAIVTALASVNGHAHEGHDHDAPPSQVSGGDRAQRLPDGAVYVPKPLQRLFAIRTVVTRVETFRATHDMPGRVIPDPNASGYVQTAVGGRLSPPPGGFPRLGSRVAAGDVLAFVTPPLQAIDRSDLRQRRGELDQQLAIVEQRLGRLESLAPSGAVARAQLDEARLEREGLLLRRAALEQVHREPEALTAPVPGVIAEGTPVAGQIAQTNSVVFRIVDPARLWVEALSFEAVAAVHRASAALPTGRSVALAFRGAGLAGNSQAVPVHFSIEGDTAGLRTGQLITVFAEAGEAQSGILAPRSAVVRAAGGQDVVFEHTRAERFEPRPVRVRPIDANQVLISAGLDAGKRIVAQGAELLDQVR